MSIDMNRLLFAAVMCCAGSAASAAETGSATQPPQVPQGPFRIVITPGSEIAVPSFTTRSTVKDAPYACDIVKERQQVLADGNQFEQRSAARAWRDSAGRTREESLNEKGEVLTVLITDPVAGLYWRLSPALKIARKTAISTGRSTAVYSVPADGRPHVLERTITAIGSEKTTFLPVALTDTQGARLENSRGTVRIAPRTDPGPAPESVLPRVYTLMPGGLGDMQWARKATEQTLSAREIDGIKVTGQLRHYDIPAGAMGNSKAITVSDETWYVPELRITLSSRHSDPRTGVSVFRIENLKREEPEAALFVPPADYIVR